MGAGKSAVGAALAQATGLPLVDLDAQIAEEAGRPIAAIFAQDGEAAFRALEAAALARALADGPAVLACGGGTPCAPGALAALRRWGLVVHLDAPLEVLAARVGQGWERPLWDGAVAARYAARQRVYRRAHLRLDARQPIPTLVDRIRRARGPRPRVELRVALGARGYPVVLGALAGLGPRLAQARAPGPCVVITDSTVAALHADAAEASLRAAGFTPRRRVFPAGEAHKTLDTWRALVEGVLDLGAERGWPVVALGGGVVGDLAGFVAATGLRGLALVQVPTTLLAMVDSSVGGKTGVNTARGKNLVGVFHQPELVYAALDTLGTLSDAELRCGLGEVLKHAVLAGEGFFGWLERRAGALLARDPRVVAEAVARCVRIKAGYVARDEREAGPRALLNLGHTVGHALELAQGYGALRHGEAVAIGMLAEAHIAARRGWAHPGFVARLRALTAALGLPTRAPGVPVDLVVAAAAMDKKRACANIVCALPLGVGAVALHPVTPEELSEAARVAVEGQEDR